MQLVYLHGFATTPEIWGKKKEGFFPELDLEDLAAESRRIADLIENDSVLIGWSMGGMLAQKIVAEFPAKVKGLVLVSSTPKFLRSDDYEQGIRPSVLKLLERKIKAEGVGAFHELMFGSERPRGSAQIEPAKALRQLAELARFDYRPYLSSIKVPTLIIHGGQDKICLPAAAAYMQQAITASQLAILQNIGHAPMIEAPQRLEQLIREFVENEIR